MIQSRNRPAEGITAALAEFASASRYETLPSEAIATVKCMLLDTLGTTLAASTLGEGCDELIALARNSGGPPESTLVGLGDRVPALIAALVNGGLAHALNYDAVGAGHLGLIPAAPLAAAERRGCSGKEFLTALIAGCETAARLTAAIPRRNEAALEGQLFGYLGVAAGVGRVLGLDAHRMRSAFGLALMQTAGARELSVVGGDPPAKAIYGAFPNHGGMLAAQLAELGLGAECDAIEGRGGLYALFYGGEFDAETLTARLGQHFALTGVSFKPWPTSGVVLPFIEAALDIVRRCRPKPGDVRRIFLRGGTGARHWIEPLAERRRPANGAAAANSVPFAVAKALANSAVTLDDFTPTGLQQAEALALAERTDHAIEPDLGQTAIVEVTMSSGEVHRGRVDSALGSPARPMSQEQLRAKFLDCARHAARSISERSLREAIELVGRLEDVGDVAVLPKLLSGS